MVEILDLIRNIGPHPLSGSKGDGCLHVTKVMPLFFFFKVSLMFSKLAFMLLVVSKSLLSQNSPGHDLSMCQLGAAARCVDPKRRLFHTSGSDAPPCVCKSHV